MGGVRTGSAALGYDPRRIHQRKTTGLRVHHTECVIEPWCGLFVAAYVTELAGAFYGYAKIYESEPEDAWSLNALIKVSSTECPCPVEALDSAFERAFAAIRGMYAGHAPVLWRELLARALRWGPASEADIGATKPYAPQSALRDAHSRRANSANSGRRMIASATALHRSSRF
jgi:hypothetical protein